MTPSGFVSPCLLRVLLPGKSCGRRSLVGCSPRGHEELDTTERLPFHFSLSCIGEGNGSPLQCSCLENPRDGGAWGAAVYGVTQSWTRLKRLSSSSSSSSLLRDSWFGLQLDWGQEEKGTTEDEMAGWHHRLNGHGFGWTPGVGDGQGGLVCCDSWGCKESDATE